MAKTREDVIDTIIAFIFRYALLFGLTKYVYDPKSHQFVRAPKGVYYSLTLHAALMLLAPCFYKYLRGGELFRSKLSRNFLQQIFAVFMGLKILAVAVTLCMQWTSRAHAQILYNEMTQIWRKNMAHLRWSEELKRRSVKFFILRTASTTLLVCNTIYAGQTYAVNLEMLLLTAYLVVTLNIIVAVMFHFGNGIIFCEYLFRILNYNLSRVVRDVHGLCFVQFASRKSLRRKARKLRRELKEIGRIHAQLRNWVVRFKDMYQIELLLILTSFLVSQVLLMFYIIVVVHSELSNGEVSDVMVASSATILSGFDLTLLFYNCGEMLNASYEAAQILKDLPARRLCCGELEKCIEMTCIEFKSDKLRLSLCGMVDLDWSKGFTVTEATWMYILLLIQIDYKNF